MASMERVRVRRLPVDRDGLVLSDALNDCKCLFVTPTHQFPTTVTMPLDRKLELLEITKRNGQFVIEDDYESDISFDLTPPQALKGLDGWGNVIYIGTLSKSLMPGLRIGYLVADREFIREARALRHHLIRHPPVNNQRSVALFLQRGYFDRFVANLTKIYRQRCEVMHEALESHFPGGVGQTGIRRGRSSGFACRRIRMRTSCAIWSRPTACSSRPAVSPSRTRKTTATTSAWDIRWIGESLISEGIEKIARAVPQAHSG